MLNYLQLFLPEHPKASRQIVFLRPGVKAPFKRLLLSSFSLLLAPSTPCIPDRSLARVVPRGMFKLKLEPFEYVLLGSLVCKPPCGS